MLRRFFKHLLLPVLLAGTSTPALAASLSVQLLDAKGKPVEDAAVFAEPAAGPAPALRARKIDIEQRDRQFHPLVTVVQTGSSVNFPNNDSVRHHVYSFSKAKLFELKLYAGVPPAPVVFDKPGTIVLGCNIHDKMVAYIRVVDTPWFGKTDKDGKVKIDGVPDGAYKLKTWVTENIAQDVASEQAVTVKGEQSVTVRLEAPAGKAN
jgi:plastocyanin